jgi:hypothetical protein
MRVITLENWDGEVPESFVNMLCEDAVDGSVDALYLILSENPAGITERFRVFLGDNDAYYDASPAAPTG